MQDFKKQKNTFKETLNQPIKIIWVNRETKQILREQISLKLI